MKKYYTQALLLAVLMLAAAFSSAQITITSDNVPTAGTTYIRGIDEMPLGIDPGSPGAGHVWDFSPLITDESTGYAYQHPLATPYPGYFPDANLAMHNTDTAYSYLYYDDEVFEALGVLVEYQDNVYAFDYTPDLIIVDFPFTYGDQINQNYVFDLIYSDNEDSVRIKTTVAKTLDADAFGTVYLPSGNYGAIRATVTQITKDTMWAQILGDWVLVAATISTANHFEWYTDDPNVDMLLVSLSYDESWSVLQRAEFFKDSFVGVEDVADKTDIQIYPNPSPGLINIETGGRSGLSLQLINMTGETLINREIASDKEEVAVPGISPGMYICRITDENAKSIYQEKLVIR
jgi:hypothetical protein